MNKSPGYGIACTVTWTELHNAIMKDGIDLTKGKCGPAVRAWIGAIVDETFSRPDPAPVWVRVPERKTVAPGELNGEKISWNDCIAEFLRLNPQPVAYNKAARLKQLNDEIAEHLAEDEQPGAVAGEIRKVAKRNLRSLIELGSDDKTLMLSCLEELS